jgi:protein ImuA
MRAGQQEIIADLRSKIERLDGSFRRRGTIPFGLDVMDMRLPGGGLAIGALHELIETGPAAEFASCTTSFAAGIAARIKGPVVWCGTRKDLFAPGLWRSGRHPDRVIYARASHDRDVLA